MDVCSEHSAHERAIEQHDERQVQVMHLASHDAEMTRKNKVERVLYML